jgi:hypothetical protein
MPDKKAEKNTEFIEAECLKVARRAFGCSHLQAVTIGPVKLTGSGSNWEVYGFSPTLPAMAHSEPLKAIAHRFGKSMRSIKMKQTNDNPCVLTMSALGHKRTFALQ